MPAGDRFFVDTNVFLYRFDERYPAKQDAAQEWVVALWTANLGEISWQVIIEFYANAERKACVSSWIARSAVEGMLLWKPQAPSAAMLERAWHWADSAQINFWDAMILAAAEHSGCRYLLSEDFQEGRHFGDITVVNPFKDRPKKYFSM